MSVVDVDRGLTFSKSKSRLFRSIVLMYGQSAPFRTSFPEDALGLSATLCRFFDCSIAAAIRKSKSERARS